MILSTKSKKIKIGLSIISIIPLWKIGGYIK